MTASLILVLILGYFAVLYAIGYLTSRQSDNSSYFTANRKSPWYLVAIGMIGSSLSGVTFISLPGAVGATPEYLESIGSVVTTRGNIRFSYMQMVFGYFFGYLVIVGVLLPLYYRLKLTSIYSYLGERLGIVSQQSGAFWFQISRMMGSAVRLYLFMLIFHEFISKQYGIPFWFTALLFLLMIWLYTYRGGVKTVVYTDTLQTLSMLVAVVLTIGFLGNTIGDGFFSAVRAAWDSDLSQVFFFDNGGTDPNYFWKQFFGGFLVTIVMTGLDQDMMQKNLTCPSLADSQKNMLTFSTVLVAVNVVFLTLGALLFIVGPQLGVEFTNRTDLIYPNLALEHAPLYIGITFLIGFIAAAFSSSDSTLTALTTSFCVDFLDMSPDSTHPDQKRSRQTIHVLLSVMMYIIVLLFHYGGLPDFQVPMTVAVALLSPLIAWLASKNTLGVARKTMGYSMGIMYMILLIFWATMGTGTAINRLFAIAAYTYGPILGLFAFGILTKRKVRDNQVWWVTLVAMLACVLLDKFSARIMNGFTFGLFILAVNGIFNFIGLYLISDEDE